MSKRIHVTLDPASIANAIRELNEYKEQINRKAQELASRLAEYGLRRVEVGYAAASVLYDGDNDVSVTVEKRDDNTCAVVASGRTVLFLEFGAGITYGSGHPQAGKFGYGPGTYPGQKHAMNPKGWWYTGSDGQSHHSYGNAPGIVMYITAMELEREVERIAREVFNS